MSDTTTEAQPKAEPKATDQQPTQGDPADEPLGDGGKKALEAERARAKDLERELNATRSRLTEIERTNESALERAQREAQEAREALPTGITAAFRDAAVTFGGIAEEDAELFLNGSDVDTLKRQAARLAERVRATSDTTAGPRPDLTQGGSGQPPALNSDGLEEALKSKLGI